VLHLTYDQCCLETQINRGGNLPICAADLLLSRAKIAIDAGDQKAAMGYLTALTDHAPEFAEGWNLSAVTLFNMGKIGPALAALERTLALEPRHFQALEGLVLIFDDAGLYQEAFEILRRIEAIVTP